MTVAGTTRAGRAIAIAGLAVLAACTASNPNYTPPTSGCTVGDRACLMSRPEQCVPGGDGGTQLVAERCPTSSSCQQGRCTPPSPQKPCAKEADCLPGQTCTVFVNPANGQLGTFCANPEGPAPGGVVCSTSEQCRADLCVALSGTTRQICYLACSGDGDCAGGRCRRFSVTVTGVQGTVQGCGPP